MLSHRTVLTRFQTIQFLSKQQLVYKGFQLVQSPQIVPQFLDWIFTWDIQEHWIYKTKSNRTPCPSLKFLPFFSRHTFQNGTWTDYCPLFSIYKEIFNFKLLKLKILAIVFFYLYSRATCHSFKHTLNIFDLQIRLDLGFSSDLRLLNQVLIPHVRK